MRADVWTFLHAGVRFLQTCGSWPSVKFSFPGEPFFIIIIIVKRKKREKVCFEPSILPFVYNYWKAGPSPLLSIFSSYLTEMIGEEESQ